MRQCSWTAGIVTYVLTGMIFWFGPMFSAGWFATLALSFAAGVAVLLSVEALFDWYERRNEEARLRRLASMFAEAAIKRADETAARERDRETRRLERVARNEQRERDRIERERREHP